MKLSALLILVTVSVLPFQACSHETETIIPSTGEHQKESNSNNMTQSINIQAGTTTLKCIMEDNTSAKALAELLADGPLTIEMDDYANMEKVGELPVSLPQNNTQLHTVPGDVILYLGRYFVIYYGNNNYNLTKLGTLEQDYSRQELKKILGDGNVSITLSL